MSPGARKRIVLAVSATLAIVLGARAVTRIARQHRIEKARDAAVAGRFTDVLELTEGEARGDADGKSAAELRCLALMALGDVGACEALVMQVHEMAHGFAPQPAVTVPLAGALAKRGQTLEAVDLVRRTLSEYPDDGPLRHLELELRLQVEDEETVLDDMERALPAMGAAAVQIRLRLAGIRLERHEAERVLELLQGQPPGPPALVAVWYDHRGRAHGELGDVAAVRRTYEEWLARGGDPHEVLARHAMVLGHYNLSDPEMPTLPALERALEQEARLQDPRLVEALYRQVISRHVLEGRREAAETWLARGRRRFPLALFDLDDMARTAEPPRAPSARPVEIAFRLEADAGRAALCLSPSSAQPIDAPFESVPWQDGVATVTRPDGGFLRWVVADDLGRPLASGATFPSGGGRLEVPVKLRAAAPSAPAADLRRKAGDGRRRVMAIVLDCGDWRLVRYGSARGELPVLEALAAGGAWGTLESRPAFTAAAMDALVRPGEPPPPTVLGALRGVGEEIAGLDVVGFNPIAFLDWALPEREDLFLGIGAGPRRAVNMLFSYGSIRAGRNAEVVGPHGRREVLRGWKHRRPLSEEELRAIPELREIAEEDAVRQMAAELDTALSLSGVHGHDLVLLRVASLDLLTHVYFAEASRSGQDDGRLRLMAVYRYVDQRLGEVARSLDDDDVLVVVSDHGIRTAMEHDPRAMFIASGPGIRPGRVEGTPSWRGLPSFLADLLGVPTSWPRTTLNDCVPAGRDAGGRRHGLPPPERGAYQPVSETAGLAP